MCSGCRNGGNKLKQLMKKNQFIITTLAVMIAVAGYLSYAQQNGAKNGYLEVNNLENAMESVGLYEISNEDVELTAAADTQGSAMVEISSLDSDPNDETTTVEESKEAVSENPGEAVLTNGSGSLAVVNEIKMNREQVRAENEAVLMEIINNVNLSEGEKAEATSQLIAMTAIAEKEAAAEMLLEAKGFTDAVVSVNGENVDVVVNAANLSDADRAQIEDIVKRKTEIAADKIVITPVISE